MQQTINILCQAFSRNSDGSWSSILITDIGTPGGAIRLPSGMTFRKGRTFIGVDVVSLLEARCAQR